MMPVVAVRECIEKLLVTYGVKSVAIPDCIESTKQMRKMLFGVLVQASFENMGQAD
jgi:hypothetical protein